MHNQNRNLDFVPAPNSARFNAFSVDSIFAAALGHFCSSFIASVIGGDFEFISSLLISVFYFAAPLTVTGTTLGKKIFGLQVLPFEENRKVTIKEALMRELVGKTVGYITFVGFAMILWRQDRRGIHDVIGKTVVMQEAAVAERQKSFISNFAKSVAVTVFLTSVSLAYVYYSSFLANVLETRLTSQGVKVSRVTGNLAEGISILGLEIRQESAAIKIGKFEFKPTDYVKILSEQTLSFEKIVVSEAEIDVGQETPENLFIGLAAMPLLGAQQPEETPTPGQPKQIKLEKFVIKNLSIEKTKIVGRTKPIDLNYLNISNLRIDKHDRLGSWSHLAVVSSFIELNTDRAELSAKRVFFEKPLSAKIFSVPGLELKTPIDIVSSIEMIDGKIKTLQANALQNKVTLVSDGTSYQLWVNKLEPNLYFGALPFEQISFYSKKDSPMQLLSTNPQSAIFKIGKGEFTYQDQQAAPEAAASSALLGSLLSDRLDASYRTAIDEFHLKLPPGFLSTIVMAGMKPEISDLRNSSPEQILNQLGVSNPQSMVNSFAPSSIPRVPATFQTQ